VILTTAVHLTMPGTADKLLLKWRNHKPPSAPHLMSQLHSAPYIIRVYYIPLWIGPFKTGTSYLQKC